ncbi:LysR substrate-binding domain-containing protein [Litoribacillus peritrichatus]|uniref:Transcriptional regulator GcvA n=1 Tax=Litoribacillus peritrichatus TaxID=718191 RepID=A0ABP7MYF8_9GAMM
MNRKLPPLNALRAFESAARHMSFTKAAEEMFITQGAVSKQIKVLEEYYGMPLFVRKHRELVLTEAGLQLLPKLTQIFDELVMVSQQIQLSNRSEVRVKVSPTFAIRWLFPRLNRFKEAHPDVPLHITSAWQCESSDRELDLNMYDLVVHCGELPIQSAYSHFLRDEMLVPVCSPNLEGVDALIANPKLLRNHTLVHPTLEHQDWSLWLSSIGYDRVGMTESEANKGAEFETLDMAITAVVAGYGITVADYMLVKEEIEAGHLIVPFDWRVKSSFVYTVRVRPERLVEPKIQAFFQWLFEQVAASSTD